MRVTAEVPAPVWYVCAVNPRLVGRTRSGEWGLRTVEVGEGFIAGEMVRTRVERAGGVLEGLGEDDEGKEEERELREVELHRDVDFASWCPLEGDGRMHLFFIFTMADASG